MEILPNGEGFVLTQKELEELVSTIQELDAKISEASVSTDTNKFASIFPRKRTYCCKFGKGDSNDRSNPNRFKHNIETYGSALAEVECTARAVAAFGPTTGTFAGVSSGRCDPNDGWNEA